jgi:hypothetical protein
MHVEYYLLRSGVLRLLGICTTKDLNDTEYYMSQYSVKDGMGWDYGFSRKKGEGFLMLIA